MTYGPINEPLWTSPDSWSEALHAPLDPVELGGYDERILTWAVDFLDTPTLNVLVSLLHRARAAEPLPTADTETEPRFDLITRQFTSSEVGAGGGHQIHRNLTAVELDNKLAEHGVTRHEGNKGRVTLAGGLQLLWQPAEAVHGD